MPPRFRTVSRAASRIIVAILGCIFLLTALPAYAWDEALKEAANAFAAGTATPQQRALLLMRNRDLNLLAMAGESEIRNEVFQYCQRDFVSVSVSVAEEAAKVAKVTFTVQSSKTETYMAGTDSDYITGATRGDQVEVMKKTYNEEFTNRIRALDDTVLPGKEWTRLNDVDFMADAANTTSEQFDEIAKLNNAAYTRPGAARYEAYSRQKGAPAPNLTDTANYVDEMQDMVHHRNAMIRNSQEELATLLKNPDAGVKGTEAYMRARALEAEMFKNKAIQGKYIERIGDATENLMRHLPPNSPLVIHAGSTLGAKAKARDMVKNSLKAELLTSMQDDIIRRQLQEHVEVLAAVAQSNPALAGECGKAIQKYSVMLTPQQKAEVLDSVRKTSGPQAAKELAATFRNTSKAETMDQAVMTIRKGCSEIGQAADKGDVERVRGAIADMEDNLNRANKLAGITENAGGRIKDLSTRLAGMTDEELEAALKNNSGLRQEIADVAKAVEFDARLFGELAGTADARRKLALRGLLAETAEGNSKWANFKNALSRANEVVPFDKVMAAVFLYWDILDAYERAGKDDTDGAVRKVLEAAVGVMDGLSPAMMAALTNAIIEATKEAGFGLAVASQDCTDLLVNIIAVKGWEDADSFGNPTETSVDKIAKQFTSEAEVRRSVESHIFNAKQGKVGTAKINDGKSDALLVKCGDQIVQLWRKRRTDLVMTYISHLGQLETVLSALPIVVKIDPAEVVLPAQDTDVTVTMQAWADPGELAKVNERLTQLQSEVSTLGGREHIAVLNLEQTVQWQYDGNEVQNTDVIDKLGQVLATTQTTFNREGPYGVGARFFWNLQIFSIIEGVGDRRTTTWNVNVSLKPWNWIKWSERLEAGDPVNTYQKEMTKTITAFGEGSFTVRQSTSAMKLTVDGPSKVKLGEQIELTAKVASGDGNTLKITKDSKIEWIVDGKVIFADKAYSFVPDKIGVIDFTLNLSREVNGKREIIATTKTPHRLEITSWKPTVAIKGPSDGEVGKQIEFTAEVTADDAMKKSLQLEWSIEGQKVSSGSGTTFMFTPVKPVKYKVKVDAYSIVGKNKFRVAGDEHILTVQKKPDEAKTDVKKEQERAREQVGRERQEAVQRAREQAEKDRVTAEQAQKAKDDQRKSPSASSAASSDTSKPSTSSATSQQKTQQVKETAAKPRSITQLSEEEKKDFLDCACSCGSSFGGGGYHPEPSESSYSPSCDDLANGPCRGGGRGACFRWQMPTGGACVTNCYAQYNIIPDSTTTNILTAENKKHNKPLKVTLAPDAKSIKAHYGTMVNLTATAEGGQPGYTYSWSGEGDAKDNTFTFINTREPGTFSVAVTVNDSDGGSATAATSIVVEALTVTIERISPAGNTVPVGGQASFKATVAGGTDVNYLWQPHPEVEFHPFEKSATTTATFRNPESVGVWVEALVKDGAVMRSAGRSNVIMMQVVNPQWALEFIPASPRVGQPVRAKISPTGPQAAAIKTAEMNFRWRLPANTKQTGTSQDDREITFVLNNIEPANISCIAATKRKNENLGGAGKTITAREYAVKVSGPRGRQEFQIWKCETQLGGAPECGMKKAENQFAAGNEILFGATVEPLPEKPVSYNWTASPSGCSIASPFSRDIGMTCSSTGSYTVTVTAKSDGLEIGSSSASVSVTISQNDINNSNKSKEAFEKLQKAKELVSQGKLDEGINLIDEALRLDPKLTEAAALVPKLKSEKQTVMKHVESIKNLPPADNIAQAENELAAAQKLHPKYAPVVEIEKSLNEAKKNIAAKKINEEEAKKKEQKDKQAQQLADEGYELEKKGDLEGAIKKYQATVKIVSDKPTSDHIVDLQKKIKELAAQDQEKKESAEEEVLEKSLVDILKRGDSVSCEAQEQHGTREGRVWPCTMRITSYDASSGAIVGELTWPTLGSINRFHGRLSGNTLDFTETEAIRAGSAHLNVAYIMKVSQNDASGSYVDHGDNSGGSAKLKKAQEKQIKADEGRKKQDTLIQKQKDAGAQKLADEGYGLEKKGDLAGAIKKYKEAVKIVPDKSTSEHIADLQTKIKEEEANMKEQAAKQKPAAGYWWLTGTAGDTVFANPGPEWSSKADYSAPHSASFYSYLKGELIHQSNFTWTQLPEIIYPGQVFPLTAQGKVVFHKDPWFVSGGLLMQFFGAMNPYWIVGDSPRPDIGVSNNVTLDVKVPFGDPDKSKEKHYLRLRLSSGTPNTNPFTYVYEWIP